MHAFCLLKMKKFLYFIMDSGNYLTLKRHESHSDRHEDFFSKLFFKHYVGYYLDTDVEVLFALGTSPQFRVLKLFKYAS